MREEKKQEGNEMYKVMIIDDEAWSREVVKSLGNWNALRLVVAAEADSGTEGLERIERIRPHIVITDMRMPGLDGTELLQLIQERFPGVKIVVMSGYDDFAYMKQAIRSRAVEYLLKPVNPDELNAALARCVAELDRERASGGATYVFADSASLERYLSIRRQISECLHSLDGEAVRQAFGELERFLGDRLPNAGDGAIASQIGHEFIVMLEAFMNEHHIDLSRLWGEEGSGRATTLVWDSVGQAVADLCRYYGDMIEAVNSARRNRSRLDMNEVKDYLDRHYQEAISLESVAQRFFVSKEHLSRMFKAFAGENLSDYIVRKRMEKAYELIVEKRLEIKHIAQLAGYLELAHFYKVFKKYYGCTPGELRKGSAGKPTGDQ
jgi:two-component system response regulator YesN